METLSQDSVDELVLSESGVVLVSHVNPVVSHTNISLCKKEGAELVSASSSPRHRDATSTRPCDHVNARWCGLRRLLFRAAGH